MGTDPTQICLAAQLETIFPIPGNIERVWLYASLQRILHEAPWARPHVGGDEVDQVLAAAHDRAERLITPAERSAPAILLSGDFAVAGAMIELGVSSPPAMCRLRALVWIALYRWQLAGRLQRTAADAVTSALRASLRSIRSTAARALNPVLMDMAHAKDMAEAVRALSRLETSEHQNLRNAWRHGLREILEAPPITPRASAPPEHRKGPSLSRTDGRIRQFGKQQDHNEVDPQLPEVIRLRRRAPVMDQESSESAEEFSAPVDLVMVPGYGNGTLTRRRAEYQARQAIWGGNALLLESHIEVLPAQIFGAVLRALVSALQEDSSDEQALGYLVCLLKSITGRTTQGIRWLCANTPAEQGIDLDRGAIEFPPFWKELASNDGTPDSFGHFRASTANQQLLVSASSRVSLPVARPIQQALCRHRHLLEALATADVQRLDRVAAEASMRISEQLGVSLSVATLRRSLGPQIMEVSGDLALAQLISGDSFGRPLALQNYYAPRRRDIARAYTLAVCGHFSTWTTTPILQAGERVGSELLVTPQAAKTLAEASGDQGHAHNVPDDRASYLSRHRQMTDHLARMIVATTGHRPTEALFALTLHDIDLRSGSALFRDKRIDAAHDPRLAALPRVVCDQISAYVRHLRTLADVIDECRQRVAAALDGIAPLLFDLDDSSLPSPLTLATLKARSPTVWHRLPWNWGRTYLRTRGIEAGAPAFLLSCQLGHLDAVGYPYSHQSPTVPSEVMRDTQPWLDRMARNQGWMVLSAEAGGDHTDDLLPLPALRDWRAQITKAEHDALEAHRRWEQMLRQQARQSRDNACRQVLEHPDVVALGIATVFRQESGPRPQPLDEMTVRRIHADLIEAAGDDASAAIAVSRALRRVLATVASRIGERYPVVPLPLAIRRPLDNPFFAGACLALSQMNALRIHVADRSAAKRPNRAFALQVARTAEALAIFGHIEDADRLISILEARTNATPSRRITDLLLVPLPDGQTTALRGMAALALANLAQAYPADRLPSREEIDATLATLFPQWATHRSDSTESLLVRLCSTTAVVNRFELSPAARFASDSTHGCTHASLDEQLALIDADPIGPERVPAHSVTAPVTTQASCALPTAPTVGAESARGQYRRLCRAIPQPHRETALPLTGHRIAATQRNTAATRVAILAELDQQLSTGVLAPVVHMLGDWIHAEAQRQNAAAKPLAYRTLETYLTRIGGALVEVLGDSRVADWTEERLEDAYAYALDASDKSRHKVAAALLSFHLHCAQRWDLPELDLAVLYSELGAKRQRADSEMILPVERDHALETIRVAAWEQQPRSFAQARIARAADWLTYPLTWGGMRLGEALGLQARDVGKCPDGQLRVSVRSNRLRPLKTASAYRAILFDSGGSEVAHRDRAQQWIDDVRRHAGARRPQSAYLLRAHGERDEPVSADAVAQMIRDALAKATGRPTERLHRLRHLAANQRITQITLASDDRRALDLPAADELCARALMPRDFHQMSVAMGHAHWRTTIQWYLHCPWVLLSRPAQNLREGFLSRRTAAGVLGYTPAAIDALLRGHDSDKLEAWFDHFRPGRPLPAGRSMRTPGTVDPDACAPWSATRVGGLVALASRTKDVEAAMRLMGASLDDCAALVTCAERWEAKIGLRLLPTHWAGRLRRCPTQAVRRVDADRPLEALWSEVDEAADTTPYRSIIEAVFTWLRPSRLHDITLPRDKATALTDWLVHAGIDRAQIERIDDVADLELLRIHRRDDVGRYHGLGLQRVLAVIGIAFELRER